jgi:hypothetical protein
MITRPMSIPSRGSRCVVAPPIMAGVLTADAVAMFAVFARHRNSTRAAGELHLAQPSLHAKIEHRRHRSPRSETATMAANRHPEWWARGTDAPRSALGNTPLGARGIPSVGS